MPRRISFSFFTLTILTVTLIGLPVLAVTTSPKTTKVTMVTLPAVPALTAKFSNSMVTLQWGKATTKVVFTGYTVLRSEKKNVIGQIIDQGDKNARGFADTAVVAGHTYYYTVRYQRAGARVTNGRQVKITIPKLTAKFSSPLTIPVKVPTAGVTDTTRILTPSTTSDIAYGVPQSSSQSPNIFSNPNPIAPTITDANASPNDIARVSTLYQLQTALQQYYNDLVSYPPGTNITLGTGQYTCLNSDGWNFSAVCPYPYFSSIPADPGSSAYVYSTVGNSYSVTVTLDGSVNGLSGKIKLTPSGIAKTP